MIEVYTATDVGNVREVNEDSLACLPNNVFVVADGMGGHAAGEIASSALVSSAREYLRDRVDITAGTLAATIREANVKILHISGEREEYRGMGTTATMLHLTGAKGFWAHVGDSRLYLLRDDQLHQITRDHSYVEELVAAGSITPAEALHHPRKNLLTRAVGVMPELEVDTGILDLRAGDVFVLCSDGLTNMVADWDITQILRENLSDEPAQKLVAAALQAGGLDNVSAITVIYDGK